MWRAAVRQLLFASERPYLNVPSVPVDAPLHPAYPAADMSGMTMAFGPPSRVAQWTRLRPAFLAP